MIWFAILACTHGKGDEGTSATFLEGASYGWAALDHRLAHWDMSVGESSAEMAVIGGTSTTGVVTKLPDGCDASTCAEFPFTDKADITIGWARLENGNVVVGSADAAWVVDVTGESTTVDVPLPSVGSGNAVAVLSGFSVDTNHPLLDDASACYTPANGWHPRHIAVSLGDATLSADGLSVSVPVSGAFEAGNSLEEARRCVDDVHAQAQVELVAHVQVIVGGASTSTTVSEAATYTYGTKSAPDPQDPPTPTSTAAAGDGEVYAWSALDWRFHVGDPEDRGAYLRTLRFVTDASAGTATGDATNYSPGTQLSGFDFTFSGTLRTVTTGGTVTRGTITDTIPATLADDGTAVDTSWSF